MRIALLALLLACATPTVGGSAPSPCVIETVLAARIGSTQVMDCGHLGLDATDATRSSTQSCVLAADLAQRPYVAEWQVQGIDSRLADAVLGLDTPEGWQSVSFSYDGGLGSADDLHPDTSAAHCTHVVQDTTCANPAATLCLTCLDPTDDDADTCVAI